jgi:hypothetical protein
LRASNKTPIKIERVSSLEAAKRRQAQHVFEHRLRQGDVGAFGHIGNNWKIFGGQAEDGVIAFAAAHCDFAVLQFERDGCIGQLGDDIGKHASGNSHGAIFRDIGRNHAANGGVKIGRGELKTVVFSFQQDIAQNRQGVAARYRASRHAQRICQISALASDLHVPVAPFVSSFRDGSL